MMNFNKSLQTFLGLRQNYIAACRFPLRAFSDRDRDREEEGPTRCHGKQSAVAQLAGIGGSEGKVAVETTPLEAPEAVQLTVNLEHVRSPINELDQRKLRHKEYTQILNELIIKPPSTYKLDLRLPFKQPEPNTDLRQSLRTCTSVEEVLQLTNNPELLAHELVKLSWELNAEKRKIEAMLENLQQIEQKMRERDQNN